MSVTNSVRKAEHLRLMTKPVFQSVSDSLADSQTQLCKLRAQGVSVFYGKKQAVFDVDLDISEKQVTSLIGPSGVVNRPLYGA